MISGEMVTYTYDSLNRLASATSSVNPGWRQGFTYDGFGNLTNVSVTKGSAPSLSATYSAATNRRTTDTADANGNIFQNGITAYDVANRVASANISGGEVRYSYGPGNKRVWRGTWVSGSQTVDELTFYSAGGAKLCAYNLSVSGSDLRATVAGNYYEYFGGKLLKNAQGWVNQDRLGSIGKFYPYGQERPSASSNGKEKFATYFRDSETGLDYAQNRYHSAGDGRFLTADPYQASAGVGDPGSWNRYAYTRGDPANRIDSTGLADEEPLIRVHHTESLGGGISSGGMIGLIGGGSNSPPPPGPAYCYDEAIKSNPWSAPPECHAAWAGQELEGQTSSSGSTQGLSDISNNVIVDQLLKVVDQSFSAACEQALGNISGVFEVPNGDGALAVHTASISDVKRMAALVTVVDFNVSTVPGVRNAFNNPNRMLTVATPLSQAGVGQPNSAQIAYRPGWELTYSSSARGGAIMHELLHGLGFSHEDLFRGLKLAQFDSNGNEVASEAIGNKLGQLCF